jgi:hypothetical protein
MACLVEIWTLVGEKQTLYTPSCLTCGWVGGDGSRVEAEAEGRMHERGERQPWQIVPGQAAGWEGDQRSRPAA